MSQPEGSGAGVTTGAAVWFAVLVGSPETATDVFAQASARLQKIWSMEVASSVWHGGSVVVGDAMRYLNQVLVLSHPGGARADIVVLLKHLEVELGRRPDQHPPVIDLDYLAEYAGDGGECWRDEAKLDHPAFRELLAQASAALPRLT